MILIHKIYGVFFGADPPVLPSWLLSSAKLTKKRVFPNAMEGHFFVFLRFRREYVCPPLIVIPTIFYRCLSDGKAVHSRQGHEHAVDAGPYLCHPILALRFH